MLDDENIGEENENAEPDNENDESASAENEKPKNTISADLIRGHINTIILRTLAERDKYGYEIIDEIEKKSHGQYELKQPTLYSALKRLENQGYIKAYWKTDETSAGGRRKYFTLTESGKDITERNRAEWEYSRTVIDNLISDRDFDFSKPAPTPVDFKILKQSTSRVPTVKGETEPEEPEAKSKDAANENMTVVEYAYLDGDKTAININLSDIQFIKENTDEPKAEEQKAEPEPIAASTQQPIAEPAPIQQNTVQEVEALPQQPFAEAAEPQQSPQEIYNQEINSQQQFYAEVQPAAQPVQQFIQQPVQQPMQQQVQPFAQQPAQQPIQTDERLNEENAQYKKLHENYMRLLDENYGKKSVREASPVLGENIDTEKLIYNNKPVTERDYKNLINDMYAQTIKQQPVTYFSEPVREQPAAEQPVRRQAPQPANDQRRVNANPAPRQSEETLHAYNDGLKILTSDRQVKPNGKYSKNYNVGETLFKSSALASIYLLLIFAIALIFKNNLCVGYAYPFIIFAIACCMVMVCGAMALCGFGRSAVKPASHGYIAISIVLTVIAIFITCVVAILLNVDFSSAADVMAKMVIPSLCLLTAPLFSAIFYLLTK